MKTISIVTIVKTMKEIVIAIIELKDRINHRLQNEKGKKFKNNNSANKMLKYSKHFRTRVKHQKLHIYIYIYIYRRHP